MSDNDENGNTSEQMLIDMSNQMKQKFDENEKEMERIKRANFHNECEMMSWYGLISALDNLIGDSPCPPEIQTISEVLTNKAEEWVKLRLSQNNPGIYLRRGMLDLNIEIIEPENNNNE